jgi:hypothetical protein
MAALLRLCNQRLSASATFSAWSSLLVLCTARFELLPQLSAFIIFLPR